MKKLLLSMCIITAALTASAQSLEGLRVSAADKASDFVIAKIDKITFSDTEMTVLLLDGTSASFADASGWTISLIPEASGIESIAIEGANLPATVHDLNGRLVLSAPRLSDISLKDLPKGVYIITSGNKTIKIER